VHELCAILSQAIIHHLHAVVLHNAHQDGLDDLVTEVDAHALPGTQSESPIRVTVLSWEEFAEAIRSEGVSISAPNRSMTIQRISVDKDRSLGWDVVPVDDLGVRRQFRERVEQNRVQTTGFEVAVVEEGVGLADVCVGPILAIGTEGFVQESGIDLFLESSHD